MNKLTQQEATHLVQSAWKEVVRCNLGMFRFGEALVFCMTNYVGSDNVDKYGLSDIVADDLHYEANQDVALAKFYKYFVQDSNNQLDSEQH